MPLYFLKDHNTEKVCRKKRWFSTKALLPLLLMPPWCLLYGYALAAPVDKLSIVLPFADDDAPYYFVNDNREIVGGISPDILKAVFSSRQLELSYVQLERAAILLEQGKYDCMSPAPPQLRGKSGFYESKEIFSTYENRVIVLASSPFTVDSLASLSDKKLLAFLGASKYLGAEYAALVSKNTKPYREFNYINIAIPMLFLKRVDALVMDKNVFSYQAGKQGYDIYQGKDKVLFYDFFLPTSYTLMCKEPGLITEFDDKIRRLRNSEQINKIISRNLSLMQE